MKFNTDFFGILAILLFLVQYGERLDGEIDMGKKVGRSSSERERKRDRERERERGSKEGKEFP